MTAAADRAARAAARAAARDKAQRRQEALDRQHRRYVLAKYGVDYDALLEAQGGRCAICRGKPRKARLHVDHDHEKERAGVPIAETVRGLLCSRCNHRLLGAAHDDASIVLRAYHYLIDPPAQRLWRSRDT